MDASRHQNHHHADHDDDHDHFVNNDHLELDDVGSFLVDNDDDLRLNACTGEEEPCGDFGPCTASTARSRCWSVIEIPSGATACSWSTTGGAPGDSSRLRWNSGEAAAGAVLL